MNRLNLKNQPLGLILAEKHAAKESCILSFQKGQIRKILMLENGNPRGCRSNITEETLGRLLISQGVLAAEVVDKTLEASEGKDGLPLGSVLVARGHLQFDKLAEILDLQLRNRVLELFTWEEGEVQILPPKSLGNEAVSLSMATPALIMAGIAHHLQNKSEAAEAFLNRNGALCPRIVEAGPLKMESLALRGQQVALARSFKGDKTVNDILATSKVDRLEIARLLFALTLLKIIEIGESPFVSAPAAVKPEQAEMVQQIQTMLKDIDKKDYFQILGITKETDEAELKKVYFKFAKEYHPDKLRNLIDLRDRKAGEELFAKISEAYNNLIDPERRKAYLDKLSHGSDEEATEKVAKILESEALFQKGRSLVKAGEFRTAKQVLEGAIELHPDEPEYRLYLGWAKYKVAFAEKKEPEMKKARMIIDENKDARKNLEVGYFFLGQIAKLEGDNQKARIFFSQAKEIRPNNHEIERELRLLDMRSEKDKKDGLGAIKGLFKKKKE